jgi:hypothetical protein
MKIIIIFALMLLSTICFSAESPANLCVGVNQILPDKELTKTIIKSLKQQVAKKENLPDTVVITKISKYMSKDKWHIIWATPENMERGIFLLSGDSRKMKYVVVWGGIAFPEEESDILQWLKKQAPAAPISLLRCAAHAITHGQE